MDNIQLLNAAKEGNLDAFSQLTEYHRNELMVHCYRMLGATQDAEDVVQITLLRAWQNLHQFIHEPSGSMRAWLYKIATNACLDVLRQHRKRILQADIPMETASIPQNQPFAEQLWLQPMPDHWLSGLIDDPEATYTNRESVNLAFVTLLQHLSPRQRAVLVLRDVLNMKANEVAALLETTQVAVNSALLRARKILQDDQTISKIRQRPLPETEQHLLNQYVQAWQAADIDRLLRLLKEDGLLTMPPLPSWYQGRAAIGAFLAAFVFAKAESEMWDVKVIQANGQPAMVLYHRPNEREPYRVFGIEVFAIEGDKIARIDLFMTGIAPHAAVNIEAAWLPYFKLPDIPTRQGEQP